MPRRLRCCDAAVQVLRETDNEAVMWGDERLLHAIAERLGWEHDGWKTSERLLRALAKTPGILERRETMLAGHWVSIFHLPQEESEFPCG